MFLCGTCTPTLTERYDKTNCNDNKRKAGASHFVLFKCGITWTDILDTAASGEWETKMGDGSVIVSPLDGNFVINSATTDSLGTDGRGRNIRDVSEFPFDYTSSSALPDRSDEEWFRSLNKDIELYTIGILDAADGLALSDDIVTLVKAGIAAPSSVALTAAQPAGFEVSITSMPQFNPVNAPGKSGQWAFSGYIRSGEVLRYAEIPGLTERIISAA